MVCIFGGISLTDPNLILTFDGTDPNHQLNQLADVLEKKHQESYLNMLIGF